MKKKARTKKDQMQIFMAKIIPSPFRVVEDSKMATTGEGYGSSGSHGRRRSQPNSVRGQQHGTIASLLRPEGPLDFPPPDGGGGRHPFLTALLHVVARNRKMRSKARQKSLRIPVSLR